MAAAFSIDDVIHQQQQQQPSEDIIAEDVPEEEEEAELAKDTSGQGDEARKRSPFCTLNWQTKPDGSAFLPSDHEALHASLKSSLQAEAKRCHYIVAATEDGPQDHVHHAHFLLEYKNQRTFDALKKKFPRANIKWRIGTVRQCRDYILKSGSTLLYEYTEPGWKGAEERKHAAGSTDQRDGDAALKCWQMILAGKPFEDIMAVCPAWAYAHKLQMEKDIEEQRRKVAIQGIVPATGWWAWQRAVLSLIQGPAGDRTIWWLYNTTGNVGKTLLQKYIHLSLGADAVQNGRTADMAHSITYSHPHTDCPIVVINFSRTQDTMVNFGAIEAIKDGMIFDPKFGSHMKTAKSRDGLSIANVHLLCFANYPPHLLHPVTGALTLSMDRWSIVEVFAGERPMEIIDNDELLNRQVAAFTKRTGLNPACIQPIIDSDPLSAPAGAGPASVVPPVSKRPVQTLRSASAPPPSEPEAKTPVLDLVADSELDRGIYLPPANQLADHDVARYHLFGSEDDCELVSVHDSQHSAPAEAQDDDVVCTGLEHHMPHKHRPRLHLPPKPERSFP